MDSDVAGDCGETQIPPHDLNSHLHLSFNHPKPFRKLKQSQNVEHWCTSRKHVSRAGNPSNAVVRDQGGRPRGPQEPQGATDRLNENDL